MICLLFACDDVISGKPATKQPDECSLLRSDRATTHRHNDKHRNRFLKHKRVK